jgi:hypothetical protein
VDTKLDLPGPAIDATPPAEAQPRVLEFTNANYVGHSPTKEFSYSIDRNRNLEDIRLTLAESRGFVFSEENLQTLELVTVNGEPLPAVVAPINAAEHGVVFRAWSLLQYCNSGTTQLGFRGKTVNGQPFVATYSMNVDVKRSKGWFHEPAEHGSKEWEERQAYRPKSPAATP